MRPFGDGVSNFGDGFQQVQDPCAAVSNFIQSYNETEYFKGWRIFQDPTAGPKLHLFQFDGAPVAPQFLVSKTPIMFPTRLLRNDSYVFVSRRGLEGEEEDLSRRDSGAEAVARPNVVAFLGAAGLFVLAASSMMF